MLLMDHFALYSAMLYFMVVANKIKAAIAGKKSKTTTATKKLLSQSI